MNCIKRLTTVRESSSSISSRRLMSITAALAGCSLGLLKRSQQGNWILYAEKTCVGRRKRLEIQSLLRRPKEMLTVHPILPSKKRNSWRIIKPRSKHLISTKESQLKRLSPQNPHPSTKRNTELSSTLRTLKLKFHLRLTKMWTTIG